MSTIPSCGCQYHSSYLLGPSLAWKLANIPLSKSHCIAALTEMFRRTLNSYSKLPEVLSKLSDVPPTI